MAFAWWDSFDEYVTADLGLVYDQVFNVGGLGIAAAAGRNGTAGLQFGCNNANYVTKSIPGTPATVGASCGLKTANNASGGIFLSFADAATVQLSFQLNGAGFMEVRRGTAGTLLATGTKLFLSATFVHFETKVLISPTVGTIVTKINGVVDINASALNTRASANSQVTHAWLGSVQNAGGGTITLDDLVLWDTTGAAPQNDYPGDVRVQSRRVNADGGVLQWTRNAGATDHSRVEEAAQDADTTYLSDATVGDRSTFAMTALTPASGTILGVAFVAVVRKDDAGARSIVTVQRDGGVNRDNATVHPLGNTYTYERDHLFLNPATGAAYTLAEANALEAGVKVNA
jgi:hypothetical protein